MADPITALSAIGLAGNVAQFVEFALKIVAKGNEAYKDINGVSDENSNIDKVTRELCTTSRKLSDSLSEYHDGSDDTGLITIAQSCENIAGDLINRLEKFKVKPGRFRRLRSLGQAIKAEWKKDEVKRLEATLKKYQRQLDTRIIVSLW